MTKVYTKKEQFQAIQFIYTTDCISDIQKLTGYDELHISYATYVPRVLIGARWTPVCDYIIKDSSGEVYSVDSEYFDKTFQLVESGA